MLKTRLITAVVALVVLGAVLFVVPAKIAHLVIGVLILAGAWEWSALLGLAGSGPRAIYVAIIGALMLAMIFFTRDYNSVLLKIACVWWFIAFLWTFIFPTPIPKVLRWICGALILVPLFVALLALYNIDPELLLFALLIVWAADIGAYFAGRQFGRVKLAPSISPGKTWEGVFGGLAVVLVLALVWAHFRELQIAVLLPFCLAVAAISIVGDLTVSMFKRTAGVKDSGKLFPGHGGVLDRIDSVAAAAPLFTLGLAWLELV